MSPKSIPVWISHSFSPSRCLLSTYFSSHSHPSLSALLRCSWLINVLSQITGALLKFVAADFEVESQSATCVNDGISLENLLFWWGQPVPEDDPIPQVTFPVNWDEESIDGRSWNSEDGYPQLREYREVLINSPAYSWLASTLTASLQHETLGDDRRARIHETVVSMLDTRKYTIKRVRFHVSWNFVEFFRYQTYELSPREALPQVLVLTGIGNNIQSSTFAEYISQVWPYYGPHILRLYQNLVSDEINGPSSC